MAAKIRLQTSRLGHVIQYHRHQAGLSRIDLAALAGIGKTALYDIEKGKQTMRWDTVMRLLEALNIHIWLDSPLMDQLDDNAHETG